MEYTLHGSSAGAGVHMLQRQAIVPPRPGKGERKPRPYSIADLNSLWATSHSQDWQAMVTLNPPPSNRLTTWIKLRETLNALKITLTNWHRRKGFPAMILVTEFDPENEEGDVCADFHLGCAALLPIEQQSMLRDWWLARHALEDNQGRSFQYDAKGGGEKLQDYLAKDISPRGGTRRHVKYPAPWLPTRTDSRLWFVIGAKRRPAHEGAKLCAKRRLRRRHFDSEHGKMKKPYTSMAA